jgi:hypothetical protein
MGSYSNTPVACVNWTYQPTHVPFQDAAEVLGISSEEVEALVDPDQGSHPHPMFYKGKKLVSYQEGTVHMDILGRYFKNQETLTPERSRVWNTWFMNLHEKTTGSKHPTSMNREEFSVWYKSSGDLDQTPEWEEAYWKAAGH